MCYVNITKLRDNLKHYIDLSIKEDIYITCNDKVVAVLSNPSDRAFAKFMSLEGCMKDYDDGKEYDDIIGEEIVKKCGY